MGRGTGNGRRPEDAPSSAYFRRAKTRAARYLGDRDRLRDLVDRAVRKSSTVPSGQIGTAVEDLKTLVRLVRAYASGAYRDVRRENLILIVAAIAYFASPIDLVPDFLPGGFFDDAAVLGFVLRRVHDELEQFLLWEDGGEIIDVHVTEVRRDA